MWLQPLLPGAGGRPGAGCGAGRPKCAAAAAVKCGRLPPLLRAAHPPLCPYWSSTAATPAAPTPPPVPPPSRSLMKDMTSKSDLYRANAIRVLCRIIDSQMLLQIERYLKQVRAPSLGAAQLLAAGSIWKPHTE